MRWALLPSGAETTSLSPGWIIEIARCSPSSVEVVIRISCAEKRMIDIGENPPLGISRIIHLHPRFSASRKARQKRSSFLEKTAGVSVDALTSRTAADSTAVAAMKSVLPIGSSPK